MSSEDTKTLEFSQYQNVDKTPSISKSSLNTQIVSVVLNTQM